MSKRGENVYKRKDGRWETRVIKGYNVQGKALYACFYGRSYKEVKEKIFSPFPYSIGSISGIEAKSSNELLFENVLNTRLESKINR
jgi:hypothetical protein